MNKKAIEMNVSTIIIVILAILVLVILALYFTGGMTKLWEKITPKAQAWDTTKVEDARQACKLYCSAGNKDIFCNHQFDITATAETPLTETCLGSTIKGYNIAECISAGFNQDSCNPSG